MASFTSVELGWDTCAFARTSVSRGDVHLSAAEVLDPAAFPGTDAFTAALTVGLLAGWRLDDINQRANEVAAFVCTNPGGMPPLPDRLMILSH